MTAPDVSLHGEADKAFEDRPYQFEATEASLAALNAGAKGHLLTLAPAAGKSVIIAMLAVAIASAGYRVLVLSHSKILIEQDAAHIEDYARSVGARVEIGVVSAGLKRRETGYPVTVGAEATVVNAVAQIGHIDAVIFDEVHRVIPGRAGRYGKIINAVEAQNPEVQFIGLSATPWRYAEGRLDELDDAYYGPVVYEWGIARGVRDGYLCPLTTVPAKAEINTAGIRVSGGDFATRPLSDEAIANVPEAVRELVSLTADRQRILVFAVDVVHALAVTDELRKQGVAAECIADELGKVHNDAALASFRGGIARAIVNIEMLTTGLNIPDIDAIAMMRPTMSSGLYVQMLGRGLRKPIFTDKANTLVIDFAGNIRRHGAVDLVDGRRKARRLDPGSRDVVACPECDRDIENGAHECPWCRADLRPRCELCASVIDGGRHCEDCKEELAEIAAEAEAARALRARHAAEADVGRAVLSHEPELPQQDDGVTLHEVASWSFQIHRPRRPRWVDDAMLPSLQVTHHLRGGGTVREWLNLEDSGTKRTRAEEWWRAHGGGWLVPMTCREALAMTATLRRPAILRCKPKPHRPKYLAIVGRRMAGSDPRTGRQ